ncbi:MAG: hypothetical protein ACFFDU_08770 [Candidatus Thorarchaeota archaeon]
MKNSRLFSVVFLVTLLVPMFITPIVPLFTAEASDFSVTSTSSFTSISSAPPLPQLPRTIRVAIYAESNLTRPSYATIGSLAYNGLDNLTNVLLSAGYQVTNLTTDNIFNHQLSTSRFDVLIIPDNLPRERIVNQVKDFWLGGGGILSFDSAISYICYAGILPHESEGSESYGVYWTYSTFTTQHDIQIRHPVTKNYQVNQLVESENMDFGKFSWAALSASSAAGEVVLLAHMAGIPDAASIVAYDSSVKGGRFVQLPLLGPVPSDMENLVIDACDWLCPRPKARITFDYTHDPYFKIDPWDPGANPSSLFVQFRNSLVNRSYTVDKLMPSPTGNLTNTRLAPYDVLICIVPNTGFNYSTTEVLSVTDFVLNGGSLLVIGERMSWNPLRVGYLNFLLSNLDIQIATPDAPGSILDTGPIHPTGEGVTSLNAPAVGTLNFTGTGYGLWGPDAANFAIGASEPGNGRVMVAADINYLEDDYITDNDNYQFGINSINWLSSAISEILLMVDFEPWHPQAYTTPVALALNELGLPYMLTYTMSYFNVSLYAQSWNLVIIDQPYWEYWDSYLNDIITYLDSGNSLIMSGFRVDSSPAHPIWAKMGFEFDSEAPDYSPVFIWDNPDGIFTQPILYGAANFTPSIDFGDEGDRVTVFSNATAIAGFTSSPTTSEAAIVVRNDFKTLYNGYIIDQFMDDTDDSTYKDNLELWINEIAFMMRPICSITPNVPVNVTEGQILTFHADVTNLGLSAALLGEITVNVPMGLGTLMDPVTQPFTIGPGDFTTLTWHVDVTGTGNFTLTFSTTYHGLQDTTYSGVPAEADIEALTEPLLPPLPPLPWWWWIVVVVVIVIVVIILVYLFIWRPRAAEGK